MMKNDDSVIEAETMNIHQKTVIFKKKTMKRYFKAVMLSL